ncbi:MAG: hypothetical protein ACXVC6_13065 [Bacteroidia bacterium]
MKNLKQYYKELGKMVYAVANADGQIKPEETAALQDFVLKDLATREKVTDSSGMNEAFYVDFEFERSIEIKLDTKKAVQSYTKFIHNNFEVGDENLIRHSLNLLEIVAAAYSRGAEKQVVLDLKMEINEISKNILQTN